MTVEQTFATTHCRFGVARRDVTPPVGIYSRSWGAATHDVAEGVHRPLTATGAGVGPPPAGGAPRGGGAGGGGGVEGGPAAGAASRSESGGGRESDVTGQSGPDKAGAASESGECDPESAA